jgi:outer membrane protein OmpA-like peptidoglycan-associated protein
MKNLFWLVLLIILPSLSQAEAVKIYDYVPSVEELRKQLQGTQDTDDDDDERSVRAYSVNDDAQESSDSSPNAKPSNLASSFTIRERREDVAPQQQENPNPPPSKPKVQQVTLPAFPINFSLGSAKILPESIKYIEGIANFIKASNIEVLIEGHTDSSGNPAANLRLSRDRAYAVVNFLIDRYNVPSEKVTPIGLGSSKPMDGEPSTSPKNRRIQIRKKVF